MTNSDTTETIAALLTGDDQDRAITAPDRPALSYRGFRDQVGATIEDLGRLGFGRTDRIAVALPPGPELATALVAIASTATVVPLNPRSRRREIETVLADCRVDAVVTSDEVPDAAAAATSSGVAYIRAVADQTAPAGVFTIEGAGSTRPSRPIETAGPDDVALLLQTSGTTAKPKRVQLTHRNLWFGARNVVDALDLGPGDVGLCVMPLFHIHGIVALLLGSMAAGSCVVCAPGFDPFRFFKWLSTEQPTWFSAAPTMHQAILARVDRQSEPLTHRLRLIRSSSAALPPPVMRRVEEVFDVPAVEAYGMTEASHQIASNPLPPLERRPGSVGMAAGSDISIMNARGDLLAPGEVGEVVVRGPNVIGGYEGDPAANREAFTNGWLRTGDQGALADDGYLRLTGRLKELINRGGEKIGPREVEDALCEHGAVAEAVVFSVPHALLGEEVGAAVVLRSAEAVSVDELRGFVRERLSAFKVPRTIVVVEHIPLGATGKVQRHRLAGTLGLA